ncbi:histone H2A.V-like [Marmota monax]|uniref:histone H2A.V-like n=1 Tax=Marmota monax TaxID=9995 RepID=UPI0026F34F5D|nr:histone H2A.V-like [Marmota monax]
MSRLQQNSKWLVVKTEKHFRKAKTKVVSRLQFPVGHIHYRLKSRTSSHGCVGMTAAVYSAANQWYFTAEVYELAGNASEDLKGKMQYLLLLATYYIHGNEELELLIKATIVGSGVIPHIHKPLGREGNRKETLSKGYLDFLSSQDSKYFISCPESMIPTFL